MGRNTAQSKKTTLGILNAQARKKRNRIIRIQKETEEANQLGITVFQLQCKKKEEADLMLEKKAAEARHIAEENARQREVFSSRSY